MLSPEIAQALRDMEWGTHAMLVYDTPQNKRDVLFGHLKVGLHQNDLVYVGSEETPTKIRAEMSTFGFDVEELEGKGELAVKNFDEVYIVDGKVDASGIISGYSRLSKQSWARGKEGVRASTEMSCFMRANKVDDLLTYEKALEPKLNFPGIGLCGYSLLEMAKSNSIDVLWPMIRAHSLVIMTGPNGSFALEPDSVNKKLVKKTMGIQA